MIKPAKIIFNRLISMMLVTVLATGLTTVGFAADPMNGVSTPVALLMDAQSGQVLYARGQNQTMYPASITKIMTALLTLEAVDTDEVMTMSYEATHSLEPGASHIALDTDERLTVLNGLYALMLPSANDAANGLAEHVQGDIDEFGTLMNTRAAELGATGTHFSNPHGLYEDDHYTTAHDMALITRQAITNPQFCDIWSTLEHTIPATNKNETRDYIRTQVDLLRPDSRYYYPECTGGKMGWVPQSKYTGVMTAERDGRILIAVLMGNSNENSLFEDAISLFNYGFEHTELFTMTADILGSKTAIAYDEDLPILELTYSGDISVWLDNDINIGDIEILWELDTEQVYLHEDRFVTVTLSLDDSHPSGQQPELGSYSIPISSQKILNTPTPPSSAQVIFSHVASPLGIALVLIGVTLVGYILWCKVLRRAYLVRERRRKRMARRAVADDSAVYLDVLAPQRRPPRPRTRPAPQGQKPPPKSRG